MAVAVDDRGVVLERLAAVVAIERQVRRKDEARLLVGDDRVCALKIEIDPSSFVPSPHKLLVSKVEPPFVQQDLSSKHLLHSFQNKINCFGAMTRGLFLNV